MNTLTDYHYLISKRKGHRNEFVLKFENPVNISISQNHKFTGVSSLAFKTNYLLLNELKDDYRINRPKYPRIEITHMYFDSYKPNDYEKRTLIEQSADSKFALIGASTISDELSAHISPSCSLSYGSEATVDYLEQIAHEEVYGKQEKEPEYSKSGKFEKPISTLVHYVFIDSGKKQTLKLLKSAESNYTPNNDSVLEEVKFKDGKHSIKYEENSSITTIITETDDGKVIVRNFSEILTAQGKMNVLHGEYREYQKDDRGRLMPQAILTFNEGSVQKDVAETSGEPLIKVVIRAQNYDKDLVHKHFRNRKNNYEDTQGDRDNPLLMFN